MVTRVTGLASGMDIDSMVKQLMTAQRVPVNKMKQQKQILEWQRSDYKDLNTILLDFRNSKLSNYRLQSTMGKKKADIAGDTNAFSVKALGTAPSNPVTMKVMQLATAATTRSTADIRTSATNGFDASKSLLSQDSKLTADIAGMTDPDAESPDTAKITFKINGTEIAIDKKTDSLNNVISQINQKTSVRAFYENGIVVLASKDMGETSNIVIEDDKLGFAANVLGLSGISSGEINKSTEAFTKANEFSASGTLTDQAYNMSGDVAALPSTLTFDINGKTITVNKDLDSLNTVLSRITTATGLKATYEDGKVAFKTSTGISANVEIANDSSKFVQNILKVTTGNSQSSSSVNAAKTFDPSEIISTQAFNLSGNISSLPTTFSFKIDGQTITVNKNTDSLNNIMNQINTSTNVRATYKDGKVVLTSKAGTGASVEISDDSENFLKNILNVENVNKKDVLMAENAGQDSKVEINGIATTRSSNSFTVDGLEYTLKAVSKFNGTTGEENDFSKYTSSTVTVTADVDAIVEQIKAFVADYNTVLQAFTTKANETRYRDFTPLTDEQREAMQETQITLWENKAKSGLLRNDAVLKNTMTRMRFDATNPVQTGSSSVRSLADIGIGSNSYEDYGQLSIKDETKLREAIQNDADGVIALFTATGSGKLNANGTKDTSDVGIAQRLYTSMLTTMNQLGEKAGTSVYSKDILNDESVIGKQLTDLNKRIKTKENRLIDLETMYYNRFTAMENAINKYNSQSSYLASQFSSS